MLNIGVIGAGNRAADVLKSIMSFELDVKICAVYDKNPLYAKQKLGGFDVANIIFYEDVDKMLHSHSYDGIMIGTNCSSHTYYAEKAFQLHIPVFLEKPVAIDLEQLARLKDVYSHFDSEVVVSFPLRTTPMVALAKEIITSGKLGTIEHVQAVNNVPYGRAYFHEWYRNEAETGGMFLQKATHDLDYINYLLGIRPVKIAAMNAKQIFKGNKPAGLLCKDCAEYETCPESPFILKHLKNEPVRGEHCCFGIDTGNEDSGSVMVRYETGMHVTYSQNFFARKKAAARGARLLGYHGTLEFDWYKDELKVMMHDTDREEVYKLDTLKLHHFGGDKLLAYNFIKVMQKKQHSVAPLEDGILSALMCLKAKESAKTDRFMDISF